MARPGPDETCSDKHLAARPRCVADVKMGGVETVNCHARSAHGHIDLTVTPSGAYDEHGYVIVEVTPRCGASRWHSPELIGRQTHCDRVC